VDRASTIYVAHDDGIKRPGWLAQNFEDSGIDILVDNPSRRLSLFRRSVGKGRVILGSNVAGTSKGTMYLVAVAASELAPPPSTGGTSGHFVAPTGTSGNSGTAASPWSLSYALSGAGGRIQAGDTVWLRGGVYPGNQDARITNGGSPIVFRQYPGERATLTGQLFVSGSGMTFWGFEVANRNAGLQPDFIGVQIAGGRNKFINLVVHDWTGNGFYASWTAPDVEITGSIVYNNGLRGSTSASHGHGVYAQNESGSKLFRDNILFNQFGYGFHLYSGTTGRLKNMTVTGNTVFNSGILGGKAQPNILYGYGTGISGAVISDNRLFTVSKGSVTLSVGADVTSSDAKITGNIAVTGEPVLALSNIAKAVVSDNTLVGPGTSGSMLFQTGGTSGWSWGQNRYYGSANTAEYLWKSGGYTFTGWRNASGFGGTDGYTSGSPSGQWVTVRPNPYERGRANVTVYNWSGAGSVAVNLSGVVSSGEGYEVRNAQDPLGAPVATGTYSGGSITIPITKVTPPMPIGGWPVAAPSTGTKFQVYIVTRRGA
jgi:hypothetical protein